MPDARAQPALESVATLGRLAQMQEDEAVEQFQRDAYGYAVRTVPMYTCRSTSS